MSHYGNFKPNAVVFMTFATVNAASPPVPTTLAGSPSIAVTRDDCTTAITAGITLAVDFGGVTGRHHVTIDCSECSTAYTAGGEYAAYIAAGTVGGASVVGYPVGSFSVRNRAALMPTDPDTTLDVTADGRAGIDWGNIEGQGAVVALTGTTIKTATDVETDTQDLQSRVPAALVGGRMSATLDTVSCEPTSVFTWGVSTLEDVLAWGGVRASNTQTQTATTTTVRNRANDCDIATSTSSDDGTTATRGSFS